MPIEHVQVLPAEGWYKVATRLCPVGVSLPLRDAFLNKLLSANGATLKTPLFSGQVLHYNPNDLPKIARPRTRVPFSSTSPFNMPIPSNASWQHVPILNSLSAPINGDTNRHWYGGEGQLLITHGVSTDPLWTIDMPEFGNDDARFNRHWMPATWNMHIPDPGPMVGGNEDAIVCILDEVTGDYAEIGNRVAYVINPTTRTITGAPGVWWARGNVDRDTGVGTTLASGGNSAGIRAANYSWMAGAITGWDVSEVLSRRRNDFGHALCVMLGLETLSLWGVQWPATAPNNGDNYGPINMGARIGIPYGTPKPIEMTTYPLGEAYWNTLQRYGAFVGDFTGGPWPVFQIDSVSVPDHQLDPMWVWWEGNAAAKHITPLLRVLA